MKILLFGGSGMVGRELANACSAHTVVSPPRSRADITDSSSVERVVAEEKPDFIINAAAIIDVGALEIPPSRTRRTRRFIRPMYTAGQKQKPRALLSRAAVVSRARHGCIRAIAAHS